MDLDIQTSNLNIHFWAKVTVLPEEWYTWYLGGAYYISEILFSKFQLQKGEHKKLCYEQVKREYNVRKKCCSCFHDKVGRFMFNLDCAWRSLPVITIHYLEISHS